MEKDNKILLGAVLILLVAMVSFNFNTLTGEVTSAKTRATITVSPSDVYFNYNELNQQTTKSVELTVDVENGKVINEVWLYRDNGERVERTDNKLCSPNDANTATYCGPGVYKVSASLSTDKEEGDYYFRINSKPSAGAGLGKVAFNSNVVTVSKFANPNKFEYP